MKPEAVVYLDSMILPVVMRNPSGFTSMAVITDFSRERRGSGMLGTFATEAEAYDCAIGFGRSEIERLRLMTLCC